jgi:predicted ATP-dependent serine protease
LALRQAQVRIVIIDSIAFHFRHGQEDMGARMRSVSTRAAELTKIATTRAVAVRCRDDGVTWRFTLCHAA